MEQKSDKILPPACKTHLLVVYQVSFLSRDPDSREKMEQIAKTMDSYQNYAAAGATTHL